MLNFSSQGPSTRSDQFGKHASHPHTYMSSHTHTHALTHAHPHALMHALTLPHLTWLHSPTLTLAHSLTHQYKNLQHKLSIFYCSLLLKLHSPSHSLPPSLKLISSYLSLPLSLTHSLSSSHSLSLSHFLSVQNRPSPFLFPWLSDKFWFNDFLS